jgi:outer membrane protein assembly factor BamB
VGDLVFIGSCNGVFRAVDLRTGGVRWETVVNTDGVQYFFHGDPAVVGDRIVAAADRATGANAHGFDRATGKEVWRHAIGRGAAGPLASLRTLVYAAPIEGQVIAFDGASGAVRWTAAIKVPGFEGPAGADGRVFAGAVDGHVHALDGTSGGELWRHQLGAPASTTPLAVGSDVFIGTGDGMFHRLAAADGRVLGSRKVDATLKPASVPVRASSDVLVLLADASADYRRIVALSPALDAVRWQVDAEKNWTTSRIFIWGDVIVMGTTTGDVIGYCAKTGAPAWTHTVKGSVRAIGGSSDTLLVGTRTGTLYALSAPRTCDGR